MLHFRKYRLNVFNYLPSTRRKDRDRTAQKTTEEIRTLLKNANLDFDSIENKALNDYLPKIFHSCPFTEELCITKQCVDCAVFINYADKQNLKSKTQKIR